jgi:hypothetical protein
MDGIESSSTITEVTPNALDEDYKLAGAGESSISRWRKDKNGWTFFAQSSRARYRLSPQKECLPS